MTPAYFTRGFAYDHWANRRTLQALKEISALEDRPRQVMAHLLAAQHVWLTRLRREDTSALVIWPDLTLDQCEPLLEQNADGCQHFLADCLSERLAEVIAYQTSTGIAFQTSVADILTQVLLHGAYHRGQLATAIKPHGATPPFTDFVFFTRET